MGELVLLPCERRSIVPGTFQWLPRGPSSYPSPHPIHSFSLKHINTHSHILCPPLNLTHKPFSLSLSLSCFRQTLLSHLVSLTCTLLCLHFPLISLMQTRPVPSSQSPHPVAHSLFRLIGVIVMPDRKSNNVQSSHLYRLLPMQQEAPCFLNVYADC